MRQWNINPSILCRKHLLGEHHELHYAWGYFLKHNASILHWINKGFLETKTLKQRHHSLVIEMTHRGYNHKSPLRYLKRIPYQDISKLDLDYNLKDLTDRCLECRKRSIEIMRGGERYERVPASLI